MWGLIDCDNFFCSCERVFRPDLMHTPLVVLSNNDGCVVARSREVKAMGIPEGIPYFELRRSYPGSGIAVFSSNYSLYADMSARVMTVLREEIPDVLRYSIDEAFLDLHGMEKNNLKAWGEHLAHKVLRCTGIPVSLGIASTKTLAKMASRYAKKYPGYNKCCVISSSGQRMKALELYPVEDVWGIGRRISRALWQMGVRTALDFATLPKPLVHRRFHAMAERTWSELNGHETIDIDGIDGVTKKTIVTSRSFPEMLTEQADLRAHISNFAARCALKLRRQHSVCTMLSVFVQSNRFRTDLEQYQSEGTYNFVTPTSTTPELVSASMQVLERVFRHGIHYKRAGVMVAGIIGEEAVQPDLFTYNPDSARKLHNISTAIDSINTRMGADTVMLVAQQYPQRDAGDKNFKYANAIRRDLKSPDYSTSMDSWIIRG